MIRLFHVSHKNSSGEGLFRDLFLHVAPGDLALVSGPSASGKSTLLRLIRGLEEPDSGTIRIGGGLSWCSPELSLIPDRTLKANILLVLRGRGLGAGYARAESQRVLDEAGLAGSGDLLPSALSSGERLRLLLILSVHPEPKALLVDDLDGSLRGDQASRARRGLVDLAGRGAAVLASTSRPEAWDGTPCRHWVLAEGQLKEEPL